MIKSFRIVGLWGHKNYDLAESFIQQDSDKLTIITGSNGTGKTTLIKLMWYMLSGHIRQAFFEIDFEEAALISTLGTVKLVKRKTRSFDTHPRDNAKIPLDTIVVDIDLTDNKGNSFYKLDALPFNELQSFIGENIGALPISSLFFPTFRRIEGGFSFGEKNESLKIIEGFKEFSKRMNYKNHKMIAFAEFDDVRSLINEISSDISNKLRPFEDNFTKFISGLSNENGKSINPKDIKAQLKNLETKREELRRPLTILSNKIDEFFFEKSVRITEEFKLGTHANLVDIENLSAGEKNFLSFLVYAISSPNGIIFIDEPELTLHMDWQRVLFPILLEIAPNTQFIVATHAATIYSNYPDRDIWLDNLIQSGHVAI